MSRSQQWQQLDVKAMPSWPLWPQVLVLGIAGVVVCTLVAWLWLLPLYDDIKRERTAFAQQQQAFATLAERYRDLPLRQRSTAKRSATESNGQIGVALIKPNEFLTQVSVLPSQHNMALEQLRPLSRGARRQTDPQAQSAERYVVEITVRGEYSALQSMLQSLLAEYRYAGVLVEQMRMQTGIIRAGLPQELLILMQLSVQVAP